MLIGFSENLSPQVGKQKIVEITAVVREPIQETFMINRFYLILIRRHSNEVRVGNRMNGHTLRGIFERTFKQVQFEIIFKYHE